MKNTHVQKGITLIEVLLVVFIIGLLCAVVSYGFSALRKQQMLLVNRDLVVSVLSKAKADTLASVNSKAYGVHFDMSGSNTMTIFEAPTYVAGAPSNQVYSLTDQARFTSFAGSDTKTVVFARLTGHVPVFSSVSIGTVAGDSTTVYVARSGIISYN